MSDLFGGPIAVICPRTNDPARKHLYGATPERCVRCTVEVMVSPATRARIRPGDQILCVECCAAIAEEHGQKWIDAGRNADQLAELAANGHEPRQFECE